MDVALSLIDLAGAVALLLWGVHMVQTAVQRAFGAKLRLVLAAALRSRVRAFAAGLGITAVLQSSTATGLMITGFVAAGLVDLVPALAVMLGANVGSTLIVQVLSFDVTRVAPALVLIGLVMFRRAAAATRDLGRAFIGLGLMLLALHQLLSLFTAFEAVPSFGLLLGAAAAHPLIDVILAAILTWAAHSSVAVVLLVMSFAARGMVTPEAAFALVLGANLGTAVNPCLEGAAGDDPASKRLPIGNLVNRLIGVAVALAVLGPVSRLIGTIEATPARAVADFHTAFNLVVALVFFPALPLYARALRRVLPSRMNEADPSRPLYLDPTAQESPVVALGAAAREALRLADLLDAMLQGFRDALARDDRRRTSEARRLADVMERLNGAIKTYLSGLDPDGLTEGDHRRVAEILAFSTNLEHAGDVVDKGLLGSLARKIKRGLAFSKEGETELIGMTDRLIANLRIAASLFVTEDVRAARMLVAEKEAFRDLENAATNAHFERLRAGRLESTETSALHLDVLRDLARVNAQLVAAVAYPVLERQGELLPSRLRQEGE